MLAVCDVHILFSLSVSWGGADDLSSIAERHNLVVGYVLRCVSWTDAAVAVDFLFWDGGAGSRRRYYLGRTEGVGLGRGLRGAFCGWMA